MTVRAPAAAAAALLLLAGTARAQEVDRRFAAPAAGVLEVVNPSGSVRVEGWDRAEVRVTGELGRGAELAELGMRGSRATVVVVPRGGGRSGGSELTIHVPARFGVQVVGQSADVSVSGVRGEVEVVSQSGDLRVAGSPAEVRAHTQSGDVGISAETRRVEARTVSGEIVVRGSARDGVEAGSVSGGVTVLARTRRVRVQATSGDVAIRGLSGAFSVNAVSGDVTLEGSGLSGEAQTVSGDLFLSGSAGRGPISLQTHGGDVALDLRGGMEVEFTTHSGDLLGRPAGVRVLRSAGEGRRIVVGDGGARVSVTTFSGDLVIGSR